MNRLKCNHNIFHFPYQNCLLYLCGTKSDLIHSGERLREVFHNEVVNYGQSKSSTVACTFRFNFCRIRVYFLSLFVIPSSS